MVWTLELEGYAASNLDIWPDFALNGLDGENLILEEHWIVLNCLANTLVLLLESSNSLLLILLLLEL